MASPLSHHAPGASNDRNRRRQPDRSSLRGPSCLRFPLRYNHAMPQTAPPTATGAPAQSHLGTVLFRPATPEQRNQRNVLIDGIGVRSRPGWAAFRMKPPYPVSSIPPYCGTICAILTAFNAPRWPAVKMQDRLDSRPTDHLHGWTEMQGKGLRLEVKCGFSSPGEPVISAATPVWSFCVPATRSSSSII